MSESNYNLYASRNLKIPDSIDFSLIPTHNRYILILTDKTPPAGFTLVPESIPLTDEEKAWKSECLRKIVEKKIKANVDFINEHADEYTELFSGFCDALEKELAKEKKKAGEKTNADSTNTD